MEVTAALTFIMFVTNKLGKNDQNPDFVCMCVCEVFFLFSTECRQAKT